MIFLKKKKKNTQTYDDFFKCPEKMSSQKCKRWDMIFLRLSAKVAFGPPPAPLKNGIFSRAENGREKTFLKKYTETWYFLFDMFHAPLPKKKKSKMILSRKNAPKGD